MATRQDYINAIDETYPVAGINNNSQGFRDNFANIKTALSLSDGSSGSGTGGSGGGTATVQATPEAMGSVLGYTTGTSAFIGADAGNILNTGTNNVAIGYNSLHFGQSVGPISAVQGIIDAGIYNSSNTLVSTFAVQPITSTQRIITTSDVDATITALSTIAIPSVSGLTLSTTPQFGDNDEGAFEITLPFDIMFLGTPYGPTAGEAVFVGTNGFLSFGNYNIDSANSPPIYYMPLIGTYLGDAWTQGIYTGSTGSSPTRTFRIVIEASASWDTGQSTALGDGDTRLEYTFYEATPNQIDVNVERNGQTVVIIPATTSTQGTGNIAIGAYALYSTSTQSWGTNNTAIGECALYNEGYGDNNIAIGKLAMFSDKCGSNNIAIGECSLYKNSTSSGFDNIAIGREALRNLCDSKNVVIGTGAFSTATHGRCNIVIGHNAGCEVTYGFCNTIIGNYTGTAGCALYGTVVINAGNCERIKIDCNGLYINGATLSTTPSINSNCNFAISSPTTGNPYSLLGNGVNNMSIGAYALFCNCAGSGNIALGYGTLCKNISGSCNIAIGASAMRSNTTGVRNIAFGQSALYNNVCGSNNVALGYFSLIANTIGNNNVAIGCQSLRFNSLGNSNVAIGAGALYGNITGGDNVAIGAGALSSNLSGNLNIGIGCNSGRLNAIGSNNVSLGNMALCCNLTSNNTAIGFCAGGTNTTGCNNSFLGNGAAGASGTTNNAITLGNASIATIRAQVTTITALSDCRDKTNIAGIPIGLDFIKEVRPVQFDWAMRDGAKVGIAEMGFIAQELDALQIKYGVESALGLVLKDNPDRLEATPGKLLPVVIKAIQELAAIVDQLGTK